MAILANRCQSRIPFLILPAGDVTYLLRDVLPIQWQINIKPNITEGTSYGDREITYHCGIKEVGGDISFLSERIEIIDSIDDIPSPLDSYSISDLMREVNKKLRMRIK